MFTLIFCLYNVWFYVIRIFLCVLKSIDPVVAVANGDLNKLK